MADTLFQRILKSVNVFARTDEDPSYRPDGPGYSYRLDRRNFYLVNERTIIPAIYNRIGIDVAAIGINHIKVNENGYFEEIIRSPLNECLTVEANIDQTGRAFIQDVVMSLCGEGSVAIVPVDTSVNPRISGSYDIHSLRTARIVQWYPRDVQVEIYNENKGHRQLLTVPKREVAIVENPLYSVMNEPNSTLKRLQDKLNILDAIDKQSGSGKLDLLIQLPYAIKSDIRQEQADKRKASIEAQLKDSPYGIAYIDSTERVTQLNRPADNNMMTTIEYLTRMLYGQLGITAEVLDGTASEATMINYYNRTIEPILSAITLSMERVFLSKTARSQGQAIRGFRDPFKLVSTEKLAELADKLTRNEIVSSNEIRAIMAMKPSDDPAANELRNKNLNQKLPEESMGIPMSDVKMEEDYDEEGVENYE